MLMDKIETINHSLFLQLNATPETAKWLIDMAYIIANHTAYLIPPLLVVMWFSGKKQGTQLAIRSSLTIILALSLSKVVGLLWPQPRPFMVPLGYTWFYHAPDYSFPSDHATLFIALAFSLLSGGAIKSGLAVLLFSFAVAWARIFLGVHFPFDMVGALLVSIGATLLVNLFWHYYGDPFTRFCLRYFSLRHKRTDDDIG